MPKQDKLTKKEQELMDELLKNGQVQIGSLLELKNIAKKLENIYGPATEIYEQINA